MVRKEAVSDRRHGQDVETMHEYMRKDGTAKRSGMKVGKLEFKQGRIIATSGRICFRDPPTGRTEPGNDRRRSAAGHKQAPTYQTRL